MLDATAQLRPVCVLHIFIATLAHFYILGPLTNRQLVGALVICGKRKGAKNRNTCPGRALRLASVPRGANSSLCLVEESRGKGRRLSLRFYLFHQSQPDNS